MKVKIALNIGIGCYDHDMENIGARSAPSNSMAQWVCQVKCPFFVNYSLLNLQHPTSLFVFLKCSYLKFKKVNYWTLLLYVNRLNEILKYLRYENDLALFFAVCWFIEIALRTSNLSDWQLITWKFPAKTQGIYK